MKNDYQTLRIKLDTSNDDIKKAYRKLAQKFYPDKNDGDKFFEDRFKEIQEAYETLSDPYEKGKYDSNFDYFFNGQQKTGQTYTRKEEPKYEPPKPDPEKVRQEKEAREKREKERAEKERVANIKKNAELQCLQFDSCKFCCFFGVSDYISYCPRSWAFKVSKYG